MSNKETNRLYSTFPRQKVPAKKKNKDWREACMNYVIGAGGSMFLHSGGKSKKEMVINDNLYNSIYDEDDLKYVTNPWKQKDGFPAKVKDINIIRPRVDLLLGEETKRPFNFMVTRSSDSATSELQEKRKQMLMDYMLSSVMANMSQEEADLFQQRLANGEVLPPEQIQRYLERDYKDIAEVTAKHALEYFKKKSNIDHEYVKALKNLLVKGSEFVKIEVENGMPKLRAVNPFNFAYDYSPDLEFIDEASWAVEHLRLPYTEIYDMLYDKMDNTQLDKLLEIACSGQAASDKTGQHGIGDYNHIQLKSYSSLDDWKMDLSGLLDVYYATWKSFRKIGFVTMLDEEGNQQTVEVDESYVVTGEELNVEWDWIIDVWGGWRIAEDLFVDVNPLEYQWISIDNPNSKSLPYTGISVKKSLVSLMKPLQYLYLIIWYRLELAIARDKGKVLNMDITQIPKSMDIDLARWAHMLSALGVNFINPYEEGYYDRHGQPSAFNQTSAQDLSMTQSIISYIEILNKIEQMIADISGVNAQRLGAVSEREAVGNVERSVVQSSLITEPIFWAHNQVKRRSLKMLLDAAKSVWATSEQTHIHYVLDDGTRSFLEINEQFLFEDFDIFVTDSTEDHMKLQMIESLYQPYLQNGGRLSDVAEIMTIKNIDGIKVKLRELEAEADQRAQQQQEAEQANQQQIAQMQIEVEERKMALQQAELDLDKYKVDQDNQTKVVVAEIQAFRFQEDLDTNNNGIPDPMEIANHALVEMETDAKIQDQQTKQSLEKTKLQNTKEIENRKISLEEKKLAAQKEIEELKAKNRLDVEKERQKNPVVGEKIKK